MLSEAKDYLHVIKVVATFTIAQVAQVPTSGPKSNKTFIRLYRLASIDLVFFKSGRVASIDLVFFTSLGCIFCEYLN